MESRLFVEQDFKSPLPRRKEFVAMRLALANDDFEWDDEEASYYDDEVINVDDNESSCANLCIERKIPNPIEFNIVDARVVIGGKELEVDAYEYLQRYQTLSKDIQEIFYFHEIYEYGLEYYLGKSNISWISLLNV